MIIMVGWYYKLTQLNTKADFASKSPQSRINCGAGGGHHYEKLSLTSPNKSVAQSVRSSTLSSTSSQTVPHQVVPCSTPASSSGLALGEADADRDGVDTVEVGEGVASLATLCVIGGSDGFSNVGASSSEWRPLVFNGRRSVPLFGCGSIPRESHRML